MSHIALRNGVIAWAMLALLGCNAEGGQLRVIAKEGDPAPGNTGNFRNFGQLNGLDPAISGENIAFGAITEENMGIYAYIDSQLRVIADTTTPLPDDTGHFGFRLSSGSSPSISGRNVAFGAVSAVEGEAIWAYMNGSLVKIAGPNTPLPGGTGTFRQFSLVNGTSPSISGENVTFGAYSEEVGEGIYAYINASLRVIADTNTLVPGAPTPRTFKNFGQLGGAGPSISGENVALIGIWSGGAGVYAYINGSLRLIADTNTPRPGGTGAFQRFGASPSISGENVAFKGSSAIYAYINGSLQVIADTHTQAPGSTNTFNPYFPLSPSISGENMAFISAANELGSGIFAYIDGELELIASENTPIPGQTTTFNTFGEGVRPAISGRSVVFTASPNGVYALLPPVAPGDFDGNGCIDLRDAAGFQRCMGISTPNLDGRTPCLCLFDADENGAIDLTDFAAFQAAIVGP